MAWSSKRPSRVYGGECALALSLLLTVSVLCWQMRSVSACPGPCSCGNGQVRCHGAGLRAIPHGIPQHATVLDMQDNYLTGQTFPQGSAQLRHAMLHTLILENNHFRVLPSNVFQTVNGRALLVLNLQNNWITQIAGGVFANFASLRRLHLGSNKIQGIAPMAFHGLRSLTHLQLDQNLMTTIPNGLFSQTLQLQELALSRNRLQALPGCLFSSLSMLRDLELDKNALQRIDENAFAGLSNLRHIDLDSNRITTLQSCAFADLISLGTLDIDHNLITQVHPNAFVGLQSLQHLNLFRNRLTALPPGVFAELPHLFYVDLSHNAISQLSANMFNDVSNLTLRLESNPLQCDCNLMWLQWLSHGNPNQHNQWQNNWNQNNNQGQQKIEGAVCFSPPQMNGNNIDSAQIQCRMPPSASVMPAQQAVRPRGSANFVCLSATQGYEVQWMRNGQPVSHRPNFITNEGLLTIRHVGPQDAGTYTCTASGQGNSQGGPGNFQGGPGNFQGGPGNFQGGPGNFQGGPGNFQGGPGNSQRGGRIPGGFQGFPSGQGNSQGGGMNQGGGQGFQSGQGNSQGGGMNQGGGQGFPSGQGNSQGGGMIPGGGQGFPSGQGNSQGGGMIPGGGQGFPSGQRRNQLGQLQVQQVARPGAQQGARAGTLTIRNARPASHMCTAAATTLQQPPQQRRATIVARCKAFSGPQNQANLLQNMGAEIPFDGVAAPNLPGWSACPNCIGTATRHGPHPWLLLISMVASLVAQYAASIATRVACVS